MEDFSIASAHWLMCVRVCSQMIFVFVFVGLKLTDYCVGTNLHEIYRRFGIAVERLSHPFSDHTKALPVIDCYGQPCYIIAAHWLLCRRRFVPTSSSCIWHWHEILADDCRVSAGLHLICTEYLILL